MQVRHLISPAIDNIHERFRFHQDVEKAINGGISFGSPSTVMFNTFHTVPKHCDNIDGVLVRIPDSGLAFTQFIINHNLNRIPVGVDVKRTNVNGVIIDSGTAWTTTQIFLSFSAAHATLLLFIH